MTTELTTEDVDINGSNDLSEDELNKLRESAARLGNQLLRKAKREDGVELDRDTDLVNGDTEYGPEKPVTVYLSVLSRPRVFVALAHGVEYTGTVGGLRATIGGTTTSLDGQLEHW